MQKITKNSIKHYFLNLPPRQQEELLSELSKLKYSTNLKSPNGHFSKLKNLQGACPYCKTKNYVKNGYNKGVQKYFCKTCHKNFTSFTGTWMARIHKKELLESYIKLIKEGYSLNHICSELKINKKTALDWKHKIMD